VATLFANPRFTPVDAQGDPYPGATLTFYAAGTTTPQPVYTTSALTTPHPNPVTANAAGQFPPIYYDDALQYRALLRDATNVLLWDVDLINSNLTADEVGRALYPRTTIEIAANITPSDYSKVPYLVTRYGIVSNGTTSQTSALVALLTAFGANNHLTLEIPANTVFDPATVFAAVGTGVRLQIHDTTNWGQPPGYRNRFAIEYTGDTVSNDTQKIIASGHHPAQMFLNMGTAASTAASDRYATQLHGVGRDYNGDPILGWLMQYAKDPTNPRWRVSWRLQTPYSVAVANPQPWAAATVYAANAYCISDDGRVYTTVAGGTSGGTAPTGTGGSINDGGVTWAYVQAALNIDGTAFDLDEKGNVGQYGPVGDSIRFSQFSGARSHYFELNDATDDILWRDASRGLDIARISTTNGLQFGVCESFPFQTMTGATPTLIHSYAYVNNGSSTTMTNMSLPGSQTSGYALLMFGNGNTTIQHGSNFVLRGATNVTPTSGQIMEFVKYSTHGSAWLEKSRSF
jgi:hypothetical protein